MIGSQYALRGLTWLKQTLRFRSHTRGGAMDPGLGSLDGGTWASVLSVEPTIIGSWPSFGFPLGVAGAIGPLFRNHPIEFLMFPAWAWELPWVTRPILRAAAAYVADQPRHRFSFVCSTAAQESRFAAAGWRVVTLNQNMFSNETLFRPLPDIEPIHDAIYNARFSPQKRIELAGEVDRLCLVYFYGSFEHTVEEFHAEHARLRAAMPQATFLNRLTPDGCEFLPPSAVNRALNESRVGLCLSPEEGQMRASIEYMMAGLPIVSTPSLGGRDYFFDDEFCSVVAPDPRSIRDAVSAMIARNIPRAYVRAKTMAKIERERTRFISFIQDIIDRHGGRTDFAMAFPDLLRNDRLAPWAPSVRAFAESLQEAIIAGQDEGSSLV